MHQVTEWLSMTFKGIIEATLHIITQYQFGSSVAYRLKIETTTSLCVQEVTSLISSAWWVHMMTSWQRDTSSITGPWFNIEMSSYQYRKSHCGDKTVVRSSYLHNGISYTGKMSSLYWIEALVFCEQSNGHWWLQKAQNPQKRWW